MDVNAYLKRIGAEKPDKIDREALDKLVQAHHLSVPFEDLECNYLKKKGFFGPGCIV